MRRYLISESNLGNTTSSHTNVELHDFLALLCLPIALPPCPESREEVGRNRFLCSVIKWTTLLPRLGVGLGSRFHAALIAVAPGT